MHQLTFAQLDGLSAAARVSPRRRMNANLHVELSDPVQRLAIAMEPDTYVRPHHHPDTWELLTALRGRFVVLGFDAAGVVTSRTLLGEEASVVETPQTGWHAVLSLDPGAVIFEIKQGPYRSAAASDFASWSPAPDSHSHRELMRWYASATIGERWTG